MLHDSWIISVRSREFCTGEGKTVAILLEVTLGKLC